jgi:hypothetical protein
MVYESPRTIFQQKLNSIFNKNTEISPFFENIFKLQQLYDYEKRQKAPVDLAQDSWKVLYELYTELGAENFAKMINIIKGRIISFPTDEEYQDNIITVLCYYFKEIENIEDWKVIKTKLNLPKINTIKYGIRVRQLKNFIDTRLLKMLQKEKCGDN